MFGGERGPHGDHGQDGAAGAAGVRGPAGPAGRDADGHSIKVTDRRLVVAFLLLVAFLGLFGYVDERKDEARDREFRQAVTSVCETNNEGNRRVNAALLGIANSANSNPNLTPEQREKRAEFYRSILLPITQCPPN